MAVGNVGVRQYLRNKGYTDDQIGYDKARNMVTAGGMDFYTPTSVKQGTSYGSQSALDSAFGNLQSNVGQQRSNNLYTQLQDALSKPFEMPEFRFDPQSDPRYQSAMNIADQNATRATGNAMSALAARGIDTSSIMGDRAAQIQQQEHSRVSGELVPQLYAQAYDQYARDLAMRYQANQDRLAGLSNLLGVTNQQNQLAIDNRYRDKTANLDAALAVGAATGRTVNPTDDWGGLFRQANREGTPLNLAGQQFALTQDQFASDEQQRALQNAWAAAEAIGTVTPELARLTGLRAGTSTLQARQILNSMANANASNARAAASSSRAADNDQFNRLMDIWRATGVAPEGIDNVAPGTPWNGSGGTGGLPTVNLNQVIDNVNRMYTQYNSTTGARTVTNPEAIEKYILSLGLTPEQTAQLYTYYGINY